MQIELRSNARQVANQALLDQRQFVTAFVRSLNRTADGLRTDAGREIRDDYNVTLKALRPGFFVRKATSASMEAIVGASGRPLQLIGFAARQVRAGVSVSVRRGVRKTLAHGFIARMPSGHVGVFQRARYVKGKVGQRMKKRKAEAIFERYTVSIPGMLGAKQIEKALRKSAAERFEKAMDQNLRYMIGRRGG